jgi:hypothetical protein
VGSYFKPSTDSVVGAHNRRVPDKKVVSASGAGPASPQTLLGDSPRLVFPAPEHIPPPVSFLKRQFGKERHFRINDPLFSDMSVSYWMSRKIKRDGTGTSHVAKSYIHHRVTANKYQVAFGPGCVISDEKFGLAADWSNANMPEATIDLEEMTGVTFAGANLRGAQIGKQSCLMENVSFAGADLEGAVINYAQMFKANFRGANVKDTTFALKRLSSTEHFMMSVSNKKVSPEKYYTIVMDFRDSNISAEQYDQLTGFQPTPDTRLNIIIDKYSLDDIAEITGEDKGALAAMLWAGDFELRNKSDDSVVENELYDKDLHYIPQWAMQNYVNTPQV